MSRTLLGHQPGHVRQEPSQAGGVPGARRPGTRLCGSSPATRSSGGLWETRPSGSSSARPSCGSLSAIRSSSSLSATRSSGSWPATRSSGSWPATCSSGRLSATRPAGSSPATRSSGRSPAIRRSSRYKEPRSSLIGESRGPVHVWRQRVLSISAGFPPRGYSNSSPVAETVVNPRARAGPVLSPDIVTVNAKCSISHLS